MSTSRGVLVFLALAVVAGAGWMAYETHHAEAESAPAVAGTTGPASVSAVTALGRLEPKDGVLRIAGPSRPSVVIAKLMVDDGDMVKAGAPIAVLDSLAEDQAVSARLKAELGNAKADWARWMELFRQGTASASLRDAAQLKVDVAVAQLQAADATVERDTVRAPVSGQILKVYSRSGERVGPSGIAEIAQNDVMYAVAEVYETDIGRVKLGQKATVSSPALSAPLTGKVEYIGLKIGKLDVLNTDPTARTDARVVEVNIRLDDSARAAPLTNLQVEIAIDSGSG